jgi:hypothetical protein
MILIIIHLNHHHYQNVDVHLNKNKIGIIFLIINFCYPVLDRLRCRIGVVDVDDTLSERPIEKKIE